MISHPPIGFMKSGGIVVPRDGPGSAFAVPLIAADFTALGILPPQSLYQFQEAAGNFADSIGAMPLTATGAPTYQNAVAAWTRKAFNTTQAVTQGGNVLVGVGPSPLLTSVAYLSYAKLTGAPTGTRDIEGNAGATGVKVQIAATGFLRAVCVGVTVIGTVNHNDGNVHPILMVYNRTAGTFTVRSNLDVVVGTYNAVTADNTKGFGSVGSNSSPMQYLWGCIASGATAESYGAATLTALGW